MTKETGEGTILASNFMEWYEGYILYKIHKEMEEQAPKYTDETGFTKLNLLREEVLKEVSDFMSDVSRALVNKQMNLLVDDFNEFMKEDDGERESKDDK